MNIAILGTKGIPNGYGGFEQFAEYLSVGLVERGHSVTVYNPSFHSYKEKFYKGVAICSKWSPERRIGSSANFIYDYLCLRDALKKDFDIILELGYHSNAPSYFLLNKKSPVVVTNMDGIEWNRSKWGSLTRKLIKRLEKVAVAKSDYLISDNRAIQEYYKKEYGVSSFYIPYGADVVHVFEEKVISQFNILPDKYYLSIARLEPENNIETILDGFIESEGTEPFVIIGDKDTKFGYYLQKKYKEENRIKFLGAIYDKKLLDNLRHFALMYFHGHSVGGTNPSLLEAMGAGAFIAAHDNLFNRDVLELNAFYFTNSEDVCQLINNRFFLVKEKEIFLLKNEKKIKECYLWTQIISGYETILLNAYK